jgi:16S rRNA U1498 N3-methylase RsmE
MSTSEIERVLRLNHGKTVKVRDTNGTFATLCADSLDQEGCSCHVSGHPDYDANYSIGEPSTRSQMGKRPLAV